MYRQSEKQLLNGNTCFTCPDNMVNFSPLTAEICWRVCGTPTNFNEFHVLAALLQGTLVVGVSQTLRRWTEGATYIRQGGHHVGHWPTFLVRYWSWLIVGCSSVLQPNDCLKNLSWVDFSRWDFNLLMSLHSLLVPTRTVYLGWPWHNFFIPYLCQLFFHHVGKLWEVFVSVTSLY